MDGNEAMMKKQEMQGDEENQRIEAANELERIAEKFRSFQPKSRVMSIVITKLEEAALWYSKILREEE